MTAATLRYAFVALVLGELLRLASTLLPGADAVTGIATGFGQASFVVLTLIGLSSFSFRERALLVAAIFLTLVLSARTNGWNITLGGLSLAAFFGVFISMLTILKVAAERSRAIGEVGRFLTLRPPGRRYYSIAVGSHILGSFLNFSAVSLMSPLIQSGARSASSTQSAELEQRQLSALIRGFSWILLWAPTTLTQAVLLKLFTGIAYTHLLALGIATSAVMILIGRLVDHIEWRASRLETGRQQIPLPGRSLLIVSVVCGALLFLTYLNVRLTGISVAEALMFVAPAVTIVWLLAQRHTPQTPGDDKPADRLPRILARAVPTLARSAVALGLSGYIGFVAARILPGASIADWIGSVNMPEWAFLALLPILITLGGQIALSPIVFVVFFGEIIAGFPTPPADPTLMVFSLSVGWALSMTASPNATATLLIAAATGIPPTTLTWKWNLRYALVCYGAFVAICATLTL